MWKLDNAHRMGSKAGVTALTLGKKNDIIISGGISGEIRVWDVATLGIISHMKQHSVSHHLIWTGIFRISFPLLKNSCNRQLSEKHLNTCPSSKELKDLCSHRVVSLL